MRKETALTLQIPVYLNQDDTLAGEVAFTVDLETAREWRRSNPPKAMSVNHGKGIELIRQPSDELTEIEKVSGWNIAPRLRRSVLRPGQSGQGIADYPIPYVFEGHLKMPRIRETNDQAGALELIAGDSVTNKAYGFRRVNLSPQNA